jgi:transposase-like protein
MLPRTLSVEFRRKVVEDHLHGGRSMVALCREYQLSRSPLPRWKKQYLTQEPTPAPTDETARKLREAEGRAHR